MRKLLMVPVMLLAACAVETPDPDLGTNVTTAGDDSAGAGAGETFESGTLSGGFTTEPISCVDHSLLFQAFVFRADGSRDFDATCQYQFADGRALDGCTLTASVPELETVTLLATDTVIGASLTDSESVQGPASFDASLDVSASGMSISWQAATSGLAGSTRISIDPPGNVVASDPSVFLAATGTISVSAPGTYTVTLDASMPIGDGSCGAQVQKTVVIEGSGNPPPCGH